MNANLKFQASSSMLAAVIAAGLVVGAAEAAPVKMRTVMHYTMGAWIRPVAVVLRSADEWTRWNDQMVAAEHAVAAELLPAGVDFSREVLLVVAIGECPQLTTFELAEPERAGRTLYFTGRIERTWTQAFSSPCHVVAIDRRFADSIVLDPGIGTLESPFGAVAGRMTLAAAGASIENRTDSWGAVKHLYR